MIAAIITIVICTTLIVLTLASLVFAEKQKKPVKSSREAIEEKRRILERRRGVWYDSFNLSAPGEHRTTCWNSVEKIDQELMELAEHLPPDDEDAT